jgi:cytoskeletal protein RodZ
MKKFKNGRVEGSTIVIILLSIALIGLGTFGIWAYINYSEAKSNVDSKVEAAVSEAKRQQKEADEEKYLIESQKEHTTFRPPADLGGVSFTYPKIWSSYIAADGSNNGSFVAYIHPTTVPPTQIDNPASSPRFALRVGIYRTSIENAMNEYKKAIDDRELSSSSVTVNGKNATKLEGLFPASTGKTDRIRGIAYFFKVNDKVLLMRTDADTFRSQFEDIVRTINF